MPSVDSQVFSFNGSRCTLIVEFEVEFCFLSKLVANDDASYPRVRYVFVSEPVSQFPGDADRADSEPCCPGRN